MVSSPNVYYKIFILVLVVALVASIFITFYQQKLARVVTFSNLPPYINVVSINMYGNETVISLIANNTISTYIPLMNGYLYIPGVGNYSVSPGILVPPHSVREFNITLPITSSLFQYVVNTSNVQISGIIGGEYNLTRFYISFSDLVKPEIILVASLYNVSFNGTYGTFFLKIITPLNSTLEYVENAYINDDTNNEVVAAMSVPLNNSIKYVNISLIQGTNYVKIPIKLSYNPFHISSLESGNIYTAGIVILLKYKLSNGDQILKEFNLTTEINYQN
ncbi:hypothetical protein SUSAZ_02080 [Sulfolobus acidocaldarius SUSAZ]|nr:hypothetical protein SUSAZ_02080 [Sulfolobus acidocaldarius SUSAZ]